MKFLYATILIVCSLFAVGSANKRIPNGLGRIPPILPAIRGDCDRQNVIQAAVLKNNTIQASLVAALNASGYSQAIVVPANGASPYVNFTVFNQYQFQILPDIQPFLKAFIFPVLSRDKQQQLNKTLEIIEQLNTNQTLINGLVGNLLSSGYVKYVQGETGSQTVDIEAVLADPGAAAVLNRFIASQVQDADENSSSEERENQKPPRKFLGGFFDNLFGGFKKKRN